MNDEEFREGDGGRGERRGERGREQARVLLQTYEQFILPAHVACLAEDALNLIILCCLQRVSDLCKDAEQRVRQYNVCVCVWCVYFGTLILRCFTVTRT